MKRPLEIAAIALGFWLLPVMGPPPAPLAPYLDLGTVARAVQPDEVLPDPALERRARALSAGLRCLVCQNQSIDDSNAELAKDLRVLVRERLTAGDSDDAVIDYLVSRYGEFVLLRPRFDWQTALLWATPLGVLLTGGGFALYASRRTRAAETSPSLSPDEERAVEKLLSERGG